MIININVTDAKYFTSMNASTSYMYAPRTRGCYIVIFQLNNTSNNTVNNMNGNTIHKTCRLTV